MMKVINQTKARALHLLSQANEHEAHTGTVPNDIADEWDLLMLWFEENDPATFNDLRERFLRTSPRGCVIFRPDL